MLSLASLAAHLTAVSDFGLFPLMVLDVDQSQNICQIYLNRCFCLSVSLSLKVQRHNNPIRFSMPGAKEFFTADSTLDSPRENAFEHQSGH